MSKRMLVLGLSALLLAACEPGVVEQGSVGLVVSALESGCLAEKGTSPASEIGTLKLVVTGPDRTTGAIEIEASKTAKVTDGKADFVFSGIPAGMGKTVTLLGYAPGASLSDDPIWFGRKRQVQVLEDKTNPLDLVLTRYGASTCVAPPDGSLADAIFPATVRLGDGRVLVTGGFQRATGEGAEVTLESPSDLAFVYDPSTGASTRIGNMTAPRAGHTMVYLPLATGAKVLVIGGAKKMTMNLSGNFPFSFDSEDGLNSFEMLDVGTMQFAAAGNDIHGNPKQMLRQRVFGTAARLFDNSVLIAGGGTWPEDQPDYRLAEIWAPYGDNGVGGLLELDQNRPAMKDQHNGAGVAKLEDTSEGLSRYLFVGGTIDPKSVLEVYTQSSQQEKGVSGIFKVLPAADLPALFFPSVTPLAPTDTGVKRFLVAGGVEYSKGIKNPSEYTYLLSIDSEDSVTVDTVDNGECSKRFFSAGLASWDGGVATLVGGFADYTGAAGSPACAFDVTSGTMTLIATPIAARAGFAAELLLDDTILLAGGIDDRFRLDGAKPMLLEVFTPDVIPLDLAAK